MASGNSVHIEGVVKRDSASRQMRNDVRVMGFCLMVPDPLNDGMDVFVDVFCNTDMSDSLDGFVSEGEFLAVDGFMTFRTMTDPKGRKKSGIMVYAERVQELEPYETEE